MTEIYCARHCNFQMWGKGGERICTRCEVKLDYYGICMEYEAKK